MATFVESYFSHFTFSSAEQSRLIAGIFQLVSGESVQHSSSSHLSSPLYFTEVNSSQEVTENQRQVEARGQMLLENNQQTLL